LVHDDQLEAAWAATEARQYAASLGGPALGGILFSAGRAVPFIGDTLSYGVSVFTSMRMKGNFRAAKPAGETRGLWAASFDAIGHVWRDPLLRAVIIQAPLINFAFSGIVFTVTIALEHAGKPAVEIGLTQSAIMVGGLLGAIAAPRIQGRFSLWALVVMLTAGGSALITIAALIMPSPLAAIPITIPFFLAPTANAALFAAMFRTTPEAMRGRVNNALIQLSTGLAALSPLLAGLLVEHASSHWAMGAFAVALATSAVMAVSLSALRVASREATTPASP